MSALTSARRRSASSWLGQSCTRAIHPGGDADYTAPARCGTSGVIGQLFLGHTALKPVDGAVSEGTPPGLIASRVETESAHKGDFRLHVTTGGINDDALVRKQIDPTDQIYTRLWMNLIQDVSEGNHQQFLTVASHPDSGKIGALAIRRLSNDPQNNLFTLAWSGTGPQLWEDTGEDVVLGVWSCVELFVLVSPTEGQVKAWVDGVLVADRQNVDTGSLPISWLRLGANGTEATSEYYFDQFAADDMALIGCEEEAPPEEFPGARTIGYWKTEPHRDHLEAMVAISPIDLGDTIVETADQGVEVLSNSKAKDARDALRAQLLGTILNLRNGADPDAAGDDIGSVVEDSIEFLATHEDPVLRKDTDREEALDLKDLLDEYNNSGDE